MYYRRVVNVRGETSGTFTIDSIKVFYDTFLIAQQCFGVITVARLPETKK